MRVLVAAVAVVMFLGVATHHANATPASDFAGARDAFKRGHYREAIPLLKDLLYPNARLSSRSELAEAHLLLGVCHFETDDQREAAAEFNKALRYDNELSLDPLLFSEEAVKFFADEKAEYDIRAQAEAEKRKLAEERDALRRALENLVVIEKHPYYINFIPFGAGQFQNGEGRKGMFFSISQATTGAASATIFGYLWVKYGFNGKVPPEDASFVRTLQQVQITTGALCLGLMAWGIVDSLRNHQPSIQRKADESLLPSDLLDKPDDKAKPRQPGASRLYLSPTIVPNGAGLAISVEF